MENSHLQYKDFTVPLTVEFGIGDTWGESHQMQKKKLKKTNPIAKDLRSPKYKQRTVKSKKFYNRKKKNIT